MRFSGMDGEMTAGSTSPHAARSRTGEADGRSGAVFHLFIAFSTITTAVAAFAVWTPFGFAATFLLTAVLAVSVPAGMPVVIACAFLFQNLVVARRTLWRRTVKSGHAPRVAAGGTRG